MFGVTISTENEILGLAAGKCKAATTVKVPNEPTKKSYCNFTPEIAAKLADQLIWIDEALEKDKKINERVTSDGKKSVQEITIDGVTRIAVDQSAYCNESE
jgi:hypothetical protein